MLHRAAPRLACVKPVASVHPEPGSNSSLFKLFLLSLARIPSPHRSPRSNSLTVSSSSISRFRYLYYLSYYVSLLKDRFLAADHRTTVRFSIAGAKVRLYFEPPNFSPSFFKDIFPDHAPISALLTVAEDVDHAKKNLDPGTFFSPAGDRSPPTTPAVRPLRWRVGYA